MKEQDRVSTKTRQAIGSAALEQTLPPGAARLVRPSLVNYGWGRLLLNAFILWNLFALTIWLLPASELRQDCVGVVTPYMTFTGLMQGWTMFSPDPSNVDIYVEAQIRYANGKVRSWNYPRMIKLGYVDRYRHERYRKLIENGYQDQNRVVWPSLAQYAARHNNTDPRNPPVFVALIRHWRTVPPPGQPFGPWNTFQFYQTTIGSQDLQ